MHPRAGRKGQLTALACVAAGLASACDATVDRASETAPVPGTGAEAARAACAERSPERRVFFGDLHVHTSLSHDAWAFDTRVTPDDAYRFARGETVYLPPLDERGVGTRPVQLERPLDFAAVTDHAEYLGPVYQCTRPGSMSYDSDACRSYREEDRPRSGVAMGAGMQGLTQSTYRRMGALSTPEVCGGDRSGCGGGTVAAWRETIEAAERWNDTSAQCRFTAFIGYEYSMTPEMTKIHRNVIFRGSAVPESPISWVEETTPWGLWRRLRTECVEAGSGCAALTIPHNPNLSNGRLFEVEYGGAQTAPQQRAAAQLRAAMEPLVEIMQIKGDSECRNGMWQVAGGRDEQCEFEKFDFNKFVPGAPPPPDCRDGAGNGAMAGRGCLSRLDFVRYALTEGLRQADRLGVNPFKVGAIGSTDTHDGTPGDVEEHLYDGRSGRRLNDFGFNPGGLAAVWAEENSREALFDAMRRRETYATSGPRMTVRFFGGWEYAQGLCAEPELAAKAYSQGVPMGSDLPQRPAGAGAPTLVAAALRDPGTATRPGGLLQRVQVIKGWVGDDGQLHQAVYDVAGSAAGGADVDPDTCEPRGRGADALCAVWRDPAFDPARRSFYYARAVENPSCRYTARLCASLPPTERPPVCSDPAVPKTIQERAWTSPIWYEPHG
jgi:hypothetical protein